MCKVFRTFGSAERHFRAKNGVSNGISAQKRALNGISGGVLNGASVLKIEYRTAYRAKMEY